MNDTDCLTIDMWATAIIAMERMLHGSRRHDSSDEARLLVQSITNNVFICGGPTEHYSKEMPVRPKSPEYDGLFPIDILYGAYIPSVRSIMIYENRIQQDCPVFDCRPEELIEIVRFHEYAHVIVHLGISVKQITDGLHNYGSEKQTDWGDFIEKRNVIFGSIGEDIHELMAQAITWASLCKLSNNYRAERLKTVFESLERKQPSHYQLSPEIKSDSPCAEWPIMLDAVRGILKVYEGPSFSMKEGVQTLIRRSADIFRKQQLEQQIDSISQ